MVDLDNLDPLVYQDLLVSLDHEEKEDLMDLLVKLVVLEKQDHLDQVDLGANVDHADLMARQEDQVQEANLATLDLWENQDPLVQLDLLDQLDL